MDKYLTVTALTKYIKRKLDIDPHLRNVWLKGEISNFKHHNRGHMYMTIKDDRTRIQAVMFAGNNRYLKFTPENGMHVLIQGDISVFEANGQYQLYIQKMEPDGFGALYLAFEQLKEKLLQQGYFDKTHKKPIPAFPSHIGVVTSPTGAAVRDIITTIKRRYPIAKITIMPALVQGPQAPDSIASAVETANKRNEFDVLIVGRGGGSIEELWAFNEVIVANAIYDSKIPVISAVGHETDVTISDYVADLRAPTPTGAAELAVPSIHELQRKIISSKRALQQKMQNMIMTEQRHLKRIRQSYAFRYPEQLVRQKEQELDRVSDQLKKTVLAISRQKSQHLDHLYSRLVLVHPNKRIQQAAKSVDYLNKQLLQSMTKRIDQTTAKLTVLIEKMSLLNPLETMKRGFAVAYKENGAILKSRKNVKKDDRISIRLYDGKLQCRVLDIEEENENGFGQGRTQL